MTWVRGHKKLKGYCVVCGCRAKEEHTVTDWVNVSGRFLERLDDYVEMCRHCRDEHKRKLQRSAWRRRWRQDVQKGLAYSETAKALR